MVWKGWRPAPLSSSFMLTAIVGFVISAIWIIPQSPDWGFTFLLVFSAMFIASVVSMTHASVDDLESVDHKRVPIKRAITLDVPTKRAATKRKARKVIPKKKITKKRRTKKVTKRVVRRKARPNLRRAPKRRAQSRTRRKTQTRKTSKRTTRRRRRR